METLTAIQEGIASATRAEGQPAAQVFSEMQATYGLHDEPLTSSLGFSAP